MNANPIRVTVWGENLHEKTDEQVRVIYPDGMQSVIVKSISAHLGSKVIVTAHH